jgi:hypothetical protein
LATVGANVGALAADADVLDLRDARTAGSMELLPCVRTISRIALESRPEAGRFLMQCFRFR